MRILMVIENRFLACSVFSENMYAQQKIDNVLQKMFFFYMKKCSFVFFKMKPKIMKRLKSGDAEKVLLLVSLV